MSIQGSNSGLNGTDITLADAKQKSTYANNGWDIDNTGSSTNTIWVITEGISYPTLRSAANVPAAAATYIVSYNGNGKDAGTVPANDSYTTGGSITVAGNSGNTTKAGCTFLGWNTAAGWTGTDYAADATIDTSGNTTLYAKWRLDTTPTAADLGLSCYNSNLYVENSALPAYDRLELFVKETIPTTEAAPTGSEGKYWLDLTNSANRTIGWHTMTYSEDANQMNYYCWYRYISGTAKSSWVQDGNPMGVLPVKDGTHEYDFLAVNATHITFNNTSGIYNGSSLYAFRSGSYVLLGEISSPNQSFTVFANDQLVIRNPNGNYS
jgi:uncharacterized repeat protein (TIGR02543 family)